MRDLGFPADGVAVVVGAGGGIGAAVSDALENTGTFTRTLRLGRHTDPPVDVTDEAAVQAAARHVAAAALPLRLLFVATGHLHDAQTQPERSLRHVSADSLLKSFAVNAVGPALLLKHFAPLLPKSGKAALVLLSARVGSIGDNRLGGWHAYRASKAALNQIVRTASVELARERPDAICVALHPGTVDTRLSAPFKKQGLSVRSPAIAADELISVVAMLTPRQSGTFLDYSGHDVPW